MLTTHLKASGKRNAAVEMIDDPRPTYPIERVKDPENRDHSPVQNT